MPNVYVKFVSKKISKVRLRPQSQSFLDAGSLILVSGSWDDEPNNLCVWRCPNNLDSSSSGDLVCQHSVDINADITDLCFAGGDLLAAALSSGDARLYRCDNQHLTEAQEWRGLHGTTSCTAIAARGTAHLATVGEDGRLCQLAPGRKQPLCVIGRADSSCMTCVTFVRQNVVAAGSLSGRLSLWDLSAPQHPVQDLRLCGERVTCASQHPSQPHLLATGTAKGRLCVWDLRKAERPAATLAGPPAPVSELTFHPARPGAPLLSCSHDGSLLYWMPSSGDGGVRAWSQEEGVHAAELVPPRGRPLNSLDVRDSLVACGSDTEAVYLLSDVPPVP